MQRKQPRFRFADEAPTRFPRRSAFEYVTGKPARKLDLLSISAAAVAGFSGTLVVMTFSPEFDSILEQVRYRAESVERTISEPLKRPFRRIARALN